MPGPGGGICIPTVAIALALKAAVLHTSNSCLIDLVKFIFICHLFYLVQYGLVDHLHCPSSVFVAAADKRLLEALPQSFYPYAGFFVWRSAIVLARLYASNVCCCFPWLVPPRLSKIQSGLSSKAPWLVCFSFKNLFELNFVVPRLSPKWVNC